MTEKPGWEEIEGLYHELADLSPAERAARLAQVCAALREEVESLLAADLAEGFPAVPPLHIAADLLEAHPGGLTLGDSVGSYTVQSLISVGGLSSPTDGARDLNGPLPDNGAKCWAIDPFHRDVKTFRRISGFIYRNDIGMAQH